MQRVHGEWNLRTALILGTVAVALVAAPASADVVLDCDFDMHQLSVPIGEGGAAAGEPSDVGETGAIVAISPGLSNAVKVTDSWTDAEGVVQFEFLNNVEVSAGDVTVRADIAFSNLDDFIFSVREQGGRAANFGDIVFTQDGNIHYGDSNTPATWCRFYETNEVYSIEYVFDLDAGTYSLTINSAAVVTDEPHGISAQGIGGLYYGVVNDADTVGMVYIDNIYVETSESVATTPTTWSTIKSLYN